MRGVIRFKPGLSEEYKDLVNSILKYETTDRLPLIKVFDHPWVKNFEKKYNLSKAPPPKSKSPGKKKEEKKIDKEKFLAAQKEAEMKAAEEDRKQREKEKEKKREELEKLKAQREAELVALKQKQLEEAAKRKAAEDEKRKKEAAAMMVKAKENLNPDDTTINFGKADYVEENTVDKTIMIPMI